LAQTIELPHVGESVVEGTIGKWLKQPGDRIERYEPLVEVVTDKVTMEVPSPVDGSLVKILAQEGETIPMGAPIAEVETADGEGSAAHPEPAAAPVLSDPTTGPTAGPVTPSAGLIGYLNTSAKMVGPTGGGAGDDSPPDLPLQVPAPATRAVAEPAQPHQPGLTASTPAAGAANGSPRLSPAVRRLAREHNIDLSRITGTGMGGRITRDDVLRYLESGAGAAATAAVTTAEPAAAQPVTATPAVAGGDEEYVALTPVRRMIAEAMVRSVTQIPHAWSAVEVDVTNLVTARVAMRESFRQREGVDLTYLPFVLRVLVESLKENPTFNASWGGDKIILKRQLNIGLAVAAPAGLVVPVIHNADRLSLSGLAHAVADLTQRARQNKLTLDDVQGGTFTLNNTGALGSTVSMPIINHPQAAIMTTEAVQKRPVVINDAIAIRSMMNLCLSFDHRINDGAESSAFIQSVKRRLESLSPDSVQG
jgi:2-oxoisovalerate dehydrogenase E2 component (dihydrolipoyl transacylase)